MNDVDSVLGAWTSATNEMFIKGISILPEAWNRLGQKDPEAHRVLSQLSMSCQATTQSTILLVRNSRLWDAEMLARSVLEGTLKFLFLCTLNDEARRVRLAEYWDTLPEISQIKRHDRIETFLAHVEAPDSFEWRPFRELLSTKEEIEALRTKYPNKRRRELDTKWSFGNIVAQLVAENPANKSLAGFMLGYGTGSHLVHQDGVGVSIVWERTTRETERREAIELNHGARELSDMLSYATLRAAGLYLLAGLAPDPIFEHENRYAPLRRKFHEAAEEWDRIEYGGGGGSADAEA